MMDFKLLIIIGFIVIVSFLLAVAHSLLSKYREKRIVGNPVQAILIKYAMVIDKSEHRSELRKTVASNYIYILDLIERSKDKDLFTPMPSFDIVNYPILKDQILPYFHKQKYYDLEPMDQSLLRLIDHYNNEMDEILSLSELLLLAIQSTPTSMHDNDATIGSMICI